MKSQYTIQPIGFVTNDFDDLENDCRLEMMAGVSIIEVLEEFEEGLTNIEKEEFINITFYFHLQDGSYELSSERSNYFNEPRGVFACRTPKRPNSLGTTTVRLIKREANKLFVTGFDALSGTPIIDIKNGNTPLLETHNTYIPRYVANPRVDIEKLLDIKDYKALLLKSAQMHNHICPGLAYGVIATTMGMVKYKEIFRDYRQVRANVYTNSCFVDGVQVVSGATIGNQSLKIIDDNKVEVSLSQKDSSKEIKVSLKEEAKLILAKLIPDFPSAAPQDKKEEMSKEERDTLIASKLLTAIKMVETENISNIFEIKILD